VRGAPVFESSHFFSGTDWACTETVSGDPQTPPKRFWLTPKPPILQRNRHFSRWSPHATARPKRFWLDLDRNGFGPLDLTESGVWRCWPGARNGFGRFSDFQDFQKRMRTCPTTCPTHLSHLFSLQYQGFDP